MFKYFNSNPRGCDTGDCVKRAIVVVTGMDYNNVSRQLNAFKKVTGAKKFNTNQNPHRYVEDILEARRIELKEGITVEAFCAANPQGRFILDLKEHWVGIYNSDHFDSWDCGKEKVNFAYEIKSEPYTPPDLKKQTFKYCCTSKKISDTETKIRIYDGNGVFTERIIPTELTEGYIRCLTDSNYNYIKT